MKNGDIRLHFRLYIVSGAPNSIQALSNLRAFCAERLALSPRVDVVDVQSEPAAALRDGVLLMPALIRVTPEPKLTIVGNLSDWNSLSRALGLPERV